MSLYFDTRVQKPDASCVSTCASWHASHALLAVAGYSQDKGGCVSIYDDRGEFVEDGASIGYSAAQVNTLAWHPSRKWLAAGWESGEMRLWIGDTADAAFATIATPHHSPLIILQWSQHGGRLVSADSTGSMVGWKVDCRGQLHVLFHHDLKDSFKQIVFKMTPPKSRGSKTSGFADEKTLEMFGAWRPRTAATNVTSVEADNHAFYVGTASGVIYLVDAQGQCKEVLDTNGAPLQVLLHHQTRESIVLVAEGFNIGHYQADAVSGRLLELTRVKLSGRADLMRIGVGSICWVGLNTLAILTGELTVRCWDLYTGSTYVLSPSTSPVGNIATSQEVFASLSFCKTNGVLAAGTNLGTIYMWKRKRNGNGNGNANETESDETDWPEVPESCSVQGTVKQLAWGEGLLRSPLMAVNCIANVFILHRQPMCAVYNDGVCASQVDPSQILIELEHQSCVVTTTIQVQMLAIGKEYLAVSSGRQVFVYKLNKRDASGQDLGLGLGFAMFSQFPCETEKMLIHGQTLIVLTPTTIQLRSMDGTVLESLPTLPEEGEPISIELTGQYLTVASLNGILKIWDLGKREAKLYTRAMATYEAISDFAEIIEARCNSDCRFVSITVAMTNLLPSSVLYVWDIESDQIHEFDFAQYEENGVDCTSSNATLNENENGNGNGNGNGNENENENGNGNENVNEAALAIKRRSRLVTAHCWDTEDPRLLVCRAQRLATSDGTQRACDAQSEPSGNKTGDDTVSAVAWSPVVLVTMFVTSDQGIVVQDAKPIIDEDCRILGVKSPYIVVLDSERKARSAIKSGTVNVNATDNNNKNNKNKVSYLPMKNFEELGSCDSATKKAILDFGFYLSVANTDSAFKAIKSIRNENVWRNLARMCVKTRQLNMALLCLGHTKQARAVRALRNALEDETLSVDAKIGILAVELGLYDEAERSLRRANRLDLAARLLEARGRFERAIELTASRNKICEKTVCYRYAKALEREGKSLEAIEMYGRADCHRFEIPRMLLSKPRELEIYLSNSDDAEIKNWLAQYRESTGDMEGALRAYEQASNTLSMARLLCYLGREEEVCELVSRTNHSASAYHLAAHYESKENVAQAVHFYTTARAYTNAIRLCKEHGMLEELWPLAVLAPSKQLQIDVAKYYEENGQADRAVILYHKAGLLHRAVDLAFRTRQYGPLQLIIMDVNADSDPALIEKCASYFVENGKIEKAVDLLATGRKYLEALRLIEEHGILLSEELAEKLTLDKAEEHDDPDMAIHERVRISALEQIGEIAFEQGNYHLATKKFTQAGNKLRAMKALLKSGDTEKICFFAQVSRQREIYIMAGNYLQSLDWQNQPDILKNIINFYSKGKAMDLLANFYVACAQVEIDEFRNYEKALDALNQASRCLGKVTMPPQDPDLHKRAVDLVNTRSSVIRRYLDIKKSFERGEVAVAVAVQQVQQLLDTHGDEIEQSVRRGDLFATVTQYYACVGETAKARAAVEELKRLVPGINLSYYYNVDLLEALGYKANVDQKGTSDDRDEDIEELVNE